MLTSLHVHMFTCLHVYMFTCLHVYILIIKNILIETSALVKISKEIFFIFDQTKSEMGL